MTKINDGGPAFPQPLAVGPAGDLYIAAQHFGCEGMTLRDWFAGQALVGFLADSGQRLIAQAIEEDDNCSLIQDAKAKAAVVNELLAGGCYALADAMLASRSKQGGEQ